MSDHTAVLVDGPRWWGDAWAMPTGRPVNPADARQRAARAIAAADEARGLAQALDALPDGCAVLHTGARGAAFQAGTWATSTQHVIGVVPAGMFVTEERRNRFAVDLIRGLREIGTPVKALICVAPANPYLGVRPDAEETDEVVRLLTEHRVHITRVVPVEAAPDPGPEADGASSE